jgi:hypothetical protein
VRIEQTLDETQLAAMEIDDLIEAKTCVQRMTDAKVDAVNKVNAILSVRLEYSQSTHIYVQSITVDDANRARLAEKQAE